jgi:hypothetical protein
MSPQGVMTRKKASYNPGMSPIEGQDVSGRMKYVNFIGRFFWNFDQSELQIAEEG